MAKLPIKGVWIKRHWLESIESTVVKILDLSCIRQLRMSNYMWNNKVVYWNLLTSILFTVLLILPVWLIHLHKNINLFVFSPYKGMSALIKFNSRYHNPFPPPHMCMTGVNTFPCYTLAWCNSTGILTKHNEYCSCTVPPLHYICKWPLIWHFCNNRYYWCLYRHECDLPERFGKKTPMNMCIAKDVTSWRNVMSQQTSWRPLQRCLHRHQWSLWLPV